MALRRVANVKHVIESTVDEDNVKGICTGNGRIKIRLNEGETINQVRLNFVRAGYSIDLHNDDPRKRPAMTGPAKEDKKSANYNAKDTKSYEL
jgi:hypothetical protein